MRALPSGQLEMTSLPEPKKAKATNKRKSRCEKSEHEGPQETQRTLLRITSLVRGRRPAFAEATARLEEESTTLGQAN